MELISSGSQVVDEGTWRDGDLGYAIFETILGKFKFLLSFAPSSNTANVNLCSSVKCYSFSRNENGELGGK